MKRRKGEANRRIFSDLRMRFRSDSDITTAVDLFLFTLRCSPIESSTHPKRTSEEI